MVGLPPKRPSSLKARVTQRQGTDSIWEELVAEGWIPRYPGPAWAPEAAARRPARAGIWQRGLWGSRDQRGMRGQQPE